MLCPIGNCFVGILWPTQMDPTGHLHRTRDLIDDLAVKNKNWWMIGSTQFHYLPSLTRCVLSTEGHPLAVFHPTLFARIASLLIHLGPIGSCQTKVNKEIKFLPLIVKSSLTLEKLTDWSIHTRSTTLIATIKERPMVIKYRCVWVHHCFDWWWWGFGWWYGGTNNVDDIGRDGGVGGAGSGGRACGSICNIFHHDQYGRLSKSDPSNDQIETNRTLGVFVTSNTHR